MNRSLCFLIMLFVYSLPSQAQDSENIQIARAMTEAINNRDLAGLAEFVSADVVRHSAATTGVVVSNLEEFRAFLETDFAAIPDSVQTINIIFGSGDLVAIRASYDGTQTGPMGPFPASGNKLHLTYIGILRFDAGKVVEIWVEWDNIDALSQLGHLQPAPD